ncbi:MAG: outer membrane protein assembly factor BamE [Gemmataceae bacterium]|nr:outer membrane protein assembly factor BamE [Gemmataceae bacterium]MCI0743412.1 outer membrane protein assembly factor BamE [Gemmataceae bacterium]
MTGRKKRVLLLLALLVVVAGGFFGMVLWLGDEGPISLSGFRRIRPGMTRGEVETLMGGAGSSNNFDWMQRWGGDAVGTSLSWGEAGRGGEYVTWEDKRCVINVWFDPDGRAREAAIYEVPEFEPTFWQRLRRWLTGG